MDPQTKKTSDSEEAQHGEELSESEIPVGTLVSQENREKVPMLCGSHDDEPYG